MSSLRLFIIVLAFCAGCEEKQAPPTVAPPVADKQPADKPAGKPDPVAGWTERKGDGFSVIAPQDPEVTTESLTTMGKPMPATLYTHYTADGPGAIQVMFTDLDAKTNTDDVKRIFDGMTAPMIRRYGGAVTKERDTMVGDAKAHEIWIDGSHPDVGKLGAHVKFVVTKKRLYLIQSLYKADAHDFIEQGDKFVDSFKLL